LSTGISDATHPIKAQNPEKRQEMFFVTAFVAVIFRLYVAIAFGLANQNIIILLRLFIKNHKGKRNT